MSDRVTDNRYTWNKNSNWKLRYSQLYSRRGLLSKPKIDESSRISFMSFDASPFVSPLVRMRSPLELNISSPSAVTSDIFQSSQGSAAVLSPRSEEYASSMTQQDDLGGKGTLLLDMVRARQREYAAEAQEKTFLDLPKDNSDDEEVMSEECVHGLNLRTTDRSVSRSRVSRFSTRRDMDIPSILAYSTSISATTPLKVHLEIPAFQKKNLETQEPIPRWSIRRSVCPVCSQKWRDKSSIKVVKNSGLKRNLLMDFPSVIAPARLRTSITLGYVPRPALAAVDEEAGMSNGGLRNTSASWQLTRARRFRIPKPQISSEATVAPCTSAPLTEKDLDQRISRFIKDGILNTEAELSD